MALIKAAIIELHEKRLRAFRRAAETDQHDPATLVRTYWRQLQKPAFIAFHELALAARTHADLARILQPLQVEFRERSQAMAFSDRKSVVYGKSVSVRVDLGGRRIIKKKKHQPKKTH